MLEIVLLSRNRPNMAFVAIDSILSQADLKFSFWVSDNSSTPEVSKLLSDCYPGIQLKVRGGYLSQFEHMKMVFLETSSPFVVLMHDDDAVSPFFSQFLLRCIKCYPDCSILFNKVLPCSTQCTSESLSIFDPLSLPSFFSPRFDRVLGDYLLGSCKDEYYSISMTMFRREAALRSLSTLNDLCIYSDATFMLSIAHNAEFIFNQTPSGLYYLGDTSISYSRSLRDIRRFAADLLKADFARGHEKDVSFLKLRYRLNSIHLYKTRPFIARSLFFSCLKFLFIPRYFPLIAYAVLRRLGFGIFIGLHRNSHQSLV